MAKQGGRRPGKRITGTPKATPRRVLPRRPPRGTSLLAEITYIWCFVEFAGPRRSLAARVCSVGVRSQGFAPFCRRSNSKKGGMLSRGCRCDGVKKEGVTQFLVNEVWQWRLGAPLIGSNRCRDQAQAYTSSMGSGGWGLSSLCGLLENARYDRTEEKEKRRTL